jgi:hypothetical protein
MRSQATTVHSRGVRIILVGFVLASCVRVWLDPGTVVGEARAQIPDAGTQRVNLLHEVRRSNELLTQILDTLAHGTLNVRTEDAEKPASAKARATRAPALGGG